MTKIKICGLSKVEDIDIVNRYKPDYVGFVFAESKRCVSKDMAEILINRLDSDIKKVGVFVNPKLEFVKNMAENLKLDVVQLHGDEDAEYINELKKYTDCEIWKAVRVSDNSDTENLAVYNSDRILLDKYKNDSYGGSGEKFDWGSFSGKNIPQNIVLAGGLDKNNVLEGIRIFNPYAVDVSSGVEVNGAKSEEKVREFIEKVRRLA